MRSRAHLGLALALAGLSILALAACGRSQPASSPPPATEAQTEAPAPAPAALSDAQKKALVAALPAAYQSADLANGQAKFATCRSCHSLAQGGEDMVGPNLWGIFGRKAGAQPGFDYSDAMKKAGWSWDAARIDAWIENPRAVLPDTKMTFIGMPSATDRRDVVAYLMTVTSPPPAGT